jgi:putative membrane protein
MSDLATHGIQHEELTHAIAAAESKTHAHIAVCIVPASDRYALYPVVWAGVAAFAVAAGLAAFHPALSLRLAFLIEAAIFCLFGLLFEWRPLRLRFVPKHARRAHAANLARREFAARILEAPKHDGILLFVSLAERYVEIIASPDLRARVDGQAWNAIVRDFIASAKAKRIQQGLLAAIAACSAILQTHYPQTRETDAR